MDPNGSTLRWRRLQGELPVLLLETALGKQKTPLEQRVRETWWKPCHSWCSPGGLETSHPKRYSFLGKSNFPFIYIARENPGWWNKLAKKKMLVHELRAFFHRCVLVQHPTQEKETSQYWIYLLRCVFFRWFFTDWDPMGWKSPLNAPPFEESVFVASLFPDPHHWPVHRKSKVITSNKWPYK